MMVRFGLRFALAFLLATSVVAGPSFTSPVHANPFKKLGSKLKNMDRTLKRGTRKFKKSPIAPIVGGLVVGVIAAKAFDDDIVGVIAGVSAGAFIAGAMSEKLNKPQKQKMTKSTISAVATGKNQQWKDKKGVTGSVNVISTEEKAEPVMVNVDKKKVEQVPPLDFIGEAYQLTSNSNIRGGPDTSFKKVGYLRSGTKVNVVGKVKDEPWYFISQDGVGIGFLFAELAKPAAASIIDKTPEPKKNDNIVQEQVAETRLCRVIEQSVTLADGSTTTETITACKGANGWEMQKAEAPAA
jgi:uncharacterized membrane protein YeaQ/YmgE (transglycosylase-associated protein family)